MAFDSPSQRQNRLTSVLGLLVLGFWQIRQVWRLFVLVTLGMIAAVMLVCALPLFTIVSTTTQVHSTFNNGLLDPTSSIQMQTTVASSTNIHQTTTAIAQEYRQIAGIFFPSAPIISLRISPSPIVQDNQLISSHVLQLHGYDNAHIASHIPLIQGHLPQADGNTLEVALSESNVQSLNAHLGSTYTIYVYPSGAQKPIPFQLIVVGIFQEVSLLDPFWHSDSFTSVYDGKTRTTFDQAIISNSDLLHLYDHWTQEAGGKALNFPTDIQYNLPLDISAVNSTNLNNLAQQLDKLSFSLPTAIRSYDMQQLAISNSDLLTLIGSAQDQNSTSQIPIILLLALMLGLILFFASIMTELLVTRQAEAVAMSRTRGATLAQIFLTFVSQSVLLGLLTLLISPLLLMLVIRFPVQIILSSTDQQALRALPTAPWDFALLLGWYPIVAVIVAVGAMCAAIWRILTSNTLGRSATLASRSFWQRMYLDLLLLLLGSLFYGLYNYLASTGLIDAQLQILLTGPCLLAATLLVCVGGVLLCMRGFPWLVQLGARLAAKRRGIVPMLPLMLLARAPRQGLRATLLLAVTIAFTLFALVFTATQIQRVPDLANYRVGADFNGIMQQASIAYNLTLVDGYPAASIRTSGPSTSQINLQSSYQHIPGVLSASIGYHVPHTFAQAAYPLTIVAVDPASFPAAVNWPQADTTQPTQLLSQLTNARPLFSNQQPNARMPAIPAIVDATTARQLHLKVGKQFMLTEFGGQVAFVDSGEIPYIPSLNDAMSLENGGQAGMLVDYVSFVNAYQHVLPDSGENLNPNTVWLQTKHDATSLSIIRRTLTNGPLALETINDRLGLIQALQHDPLYLNIQFALTLGIGLSLLLALLGYITSMWLAVRTRLRSLVVLRALGMSPRQLIAQLACEQGITSIFAIVVGIASGIVFTALALPSLVFSGVAQTGALSNAYTSNIYLLQFVPTLHMVIPHSLLIGLAAIIALCLVALGITTYTAARPSLAQTLRLAEYVEEVPLFVARTLEETTQSTQSTTSAYPVNSGQQQKAAQPVLRSVRPHLNSTLAMRALTPMRRLWGYLTLTGVGIMIPVILVCAVPLFSQVAATAGLRDILAQPANQSVVISDSFTSGYNRYGQPLASVTPQVLNTQKILDRALLQNSRPFFHDPAFVNIIGGLVTEDRNQYIIPKAGPALTFIGISSYKLSTYTQIVQGQMPQPASLLQVALTPADAARLHVTVGETVTSQMGYPFSMKIVGLFQPLSANGAFPSTTQNTPTPNNPRQSNFTPQPTLAPTNVLVSAEGFLQAIANQSQVHSPSGEQLLLAGEIDWHYSINWTHVTIDQLNTMIATFSTLIQDGAVQKNGLPIDALTQYQTSVQIAQVSIRTIVALIVGLVLLFLSFMAELLVEQESTTIVVLRSRGATQQQIFGAFLARLLLLSAGGVVLGMALVIPTVAVLTRFVLLPADQSSLQLVTAQPLQSILAFFPYVLGCLAVMLVTLSFVLYRAIGANILTLRQETTRSTYKPLWQRYYLDVVGIILTLAAYGSSLYLTRAGLLTAQINVLVKSPLVVATTVCLMLACMLVFLRIFPWLLKLGTRLALHNSNRIEPMLALSQMARAPRQHIRVVLLLLITTAFVVFVSVFTASQNQHINDVAQYWSGSDFSGPLTVPITGKHATDTQASYLHLPGVTSVAVGSTSTFVDISRSLAIKMVAVDPTRFFQTVDWPAGMAPQHQDTLIQQLTTQRAYLAKLASGSQVLPEVPRNSAPVPVIVDASIWNTYQLSLGQEFTIYGQFFRTFRVVGEINYIPSSGDGGQIPSDASALFPTMLADYQSFASDETALAQSLPPQSGQQAVGDTTTPLDYVWLKTNGNARDVANTRQALHTGVLGISRLSDRYAMLQQLTNDPLNHNLVGILLLGALTPLVLAWIGCLLAYWVNIRQRWVLFGVLRALGSTPGQLTRVLLWEQSMIYGAAIVLGALFGLLAALMALPSLILTTTLPDQLVTSSLDLFSFQNVPPVHMVIAPSLGLVIGSLILLGLLTLIFIYQTTSRLALAQTLRLSQD